MPGPSRRHKHKLEPISVDEIMDNPAMGGLLSFLEVPPAGRTGPAEPATVPSLPTDGSLSPEASLSPGPSLSPGASETTRSTVLRSEKTSQTSAVSLTTGPSLSPVYTDQRGRLVDSKYVRICRSIQDGHSPTEHMVYQSLWNQAHPAGEGYRTISRGYDRIANDNALSKRNVQRVMESLIEKLTIEILESEISADRIGKTYRVWEAGEVLGRRSAAGLKWVYRNRTAVELVRLATVASLAADARQTPGQR